MFILQDKREFILSCSQFLIITEQKSTKNSWETKLNAASETINFQILFSLNYFRIQNLKKAKKLLDQNLHLQL